MIYKKMQHDRSEHVAAMKKRHRMEMEDLEQKRASESVIAALERKHKADRDAVKICDEALENRIGFMRRELHMMEDINYCEACFEIIEPGVRCFQMGFMTPLAAQYCEECAE